MDVMSVESPKGLPVQAEPSWKDWLAFMQWTEGEMCLLMVREGTDPEWFMWDAGELLSYHRGKVRDESYGTRVAFEERVEHDDVYPQRRTDTPFADKNNGTCPKCGESYHKRITEDGLTTYDHYEGVGIRTCEVWIDD